MTAALAGACSFGSFEQSDCTSTAQCQAAFGAGSVCVDGFCTAAVDTGGDTGGNDAQDTNDTQSDTPEDTISEVGEDTGADPPTDTVDTTEDTPQDVDEDTGEEVGDVADEDVASNPWDGLVLNEVAAAGNPSDWFEIHYSGDEVLDLSTYHLSDSIGSPTRANFPAGITIGPGEYYVVFICNTDTIEECPTDEDTVFGFGVGSDEEFVIAAPDGTVIDATDWEEGASPAGGSWGRFPDITGEFQTLTTATLGEANIERAIACGDGFIDGLEQCDDGDDPPEADDGCNTSCRVESGWDCDGLEPTTCTLLCGNGDIDILSEICDTEDFGARDCVTFGLRTPAVGSGMTCESECTVIDPAGCDAPLGPVVINEVTSVDGSEAIELHNPTGGEVDISNWTLEDNLSASDFVVPADTPLAAGGFISFDDADLIFEVETDDVIVLRNEDGDIIDEVDWINGDAQIAGTASYCRLPDGGGAFEVCATPSFGVANE